jgi:hypothetical protein
VPPIGPDAAAVSAAGTIGGTGSTLWFSSFAIFISPFEKETGRKFKTPDPLLL